MAREMKNSGVSWIGEIPQGWNVVPFRSYVKERAEKNKGEKTRELLALSYALGVTLYKDKVFNMDRVKENYEDYQLVYENDLVLSPNDIIKGSVYVSKYYGCISPMYSVFSARSPKTHYLPYLSYLLRTKEAGRKFFSIARGLIGGITDTGKYVTRRMTVSRQDLLLFKVLLPSPIEQQAIVDFLDTKCSEIDGLLVDLDAEVKTLVEYKKSIITETVIRGLNPNVPMKQSGIPWAETIPAHWATEKFRYKLRVRRVSGFGDKQVLSVYREYGVIPKDSRDDNHNVTSEDTSKYKYVRPNDFVINKMKAWQGSMGVSEYEGIVSPAYFVYEFSDDDYNPRFFHYFMRNTNNIPEYRRLSGGIREGQWDLSPYDLGNMPIIVPPKSEQNEIVVYLDEKCAAIDQAIADKQTQIETLKSYKASLIYEYVTGKKQVI